LAALAPDDVAMEAVGLVRRLLSGARDAGATVLLGRRALAVETRHGRVAGVQVAAELHRGVIPAEAVMLANGVGAQALARDLDLGLREEPAVLVRMGAAPGLLRHLLCGPGVDLRPDLPSGLVAAADDPANGEAGLEAGLEALGAGTRDAVAGLFAPRPALWLGEAASAAARPMTADGRPLGGALPGAAGLYAAVAHPGVGLAPHLGRLVAEAVAGRVTPAS
jgi:glycine/D-amino acid oxidase-like deaminating enzyme